jgi:transposase
VTLQILWDEYIERQPDGYRYPRFCELYRSWASRLSVTTRQTHGGGEKLFVDCAGDTVPVIVDRLTGKTRPAQIFVAVLGASNFTYAEASWTQALGDWIGAHTRAFAAIGGVPRLVVPDDTKGAVIKACLYEPRVNRSHAEMAAHYGTAILPARPRRLRDKAKVGAAVLIVERWLLGGLRHRRFYSLADTAWPSSTQRSPSCCGTSTKSARCGGSASPAAPCSKNSIGPTSRGCPPSRIPSPNGPCAGSASTITSRSRLTSIVSRIASRAASSLVWALRGARGSPLFATWTTLFPSHAVISPESRGF